MKSGREPLSFIFERVVAMCQQTYPHVQWEVQKTHDPDTYKLIGEVHGIRTFDAMKRTTGVNSLLETAAVHAKAIVDRIERVKPK